MKKRYLLNGLLALLALGIGAIFFMIPLSGLTVFASPDETAVYVASQAIWGTGKAIAPFPVLDGVPTLHPRSWVFHNGSFVPVGFLGLPMILSPISHWAHERGAMVAMALLALSAVIPLWGLSRRWGRPAQWVTIFSYLTFPTIVLYANRGLFPNLAVTILTLWSVYILYASNKWLESFLAGIVFGLALSIRPTELIWMVAWVVAVFFLKRSEKRWNRHQTWAMVLGAILGVIPALIVTRLTYGSWWTVGYWLRDPLTEAMAQSIRPPSPDVSSFARIWPFGFHPSAMAKNVWYFGFRFLLPWTLFGGTAFILLLRARERVMTSVVALTTAVLVMMYGQQFYQDHPGYNVVSLGNSFLRYGIPLVVLFAGGMGYLTTVALRRRRMIQTAFYISVALLCSAGLFLGVTKSDESVALTARELARYQVIRTKISELLPNMPEPWVVVGDRADKIVEGLPKVVVGSSSPTEDEFVDIKARVPGILEIGAPKTPLPMDAMYCEFPNGEALHWVCLR